MKESWLQKTQRAYDHKLEKRKKKLQKEIEDLEANYREYPWDRYQKAIHNRQFELDEINASYNFDKANYACVVDDFEFIERAKRGGVW